MALSNAERQKRFRARLKARAEGADIVEQVQETVDRAFAVIWDALVRNADTIGGGPDTFDSFLAFKQNAAAQNGIDSLSLFEGWNDPLWESYLSDEERATITLAAGIYRAVLLKHVELPQTSKRKRK